MNEKSLEKILLAITDTALAGVIVAGLKQVGYIVDTVLNGNDVLEKLKSFNPDLLLVDTELPGKSGYEILNEKSFDKDITKIPVIIVSNNGNPIQMRDIPNTPVMKDFIVKSHIEPEEVIEKVNKVFGRGHVEATVVASSPIQGKKILWVEDDKLLSSILSKKFETMKFTLLKANSGEEAFRFLAVEVPDIVVLDIMLPEMSGFDILQKIKMEERLKHIPVIMLSNLSKQGDIERAKMLGANKFIVKAAVSLDEIIHEVGLLIKK